tara:strand:+ start:1750 stop:2013 length:264 start_codon:yes stop_codon:yes gene_type:complete
MYIIFHILLFSVLFSQTTVCPANNQIDSRSIYNIGETLSTEDQNILFPVCNGSGDYSDDDFFSFADLNGNLNGGDYKISIISMNATW